MRMMEGIIFLYSGCKEEEYKDEVDLLLSRAAKRSLTEQRSVSNRLIIARYKTKIRNVSIIQCYASIKTSEPEKKKEFYRLLRETSGKISKKDILIIMGDLNAKVAVQTMRE